MKLKTRLNSCMQLLAKIHTIPTDWYDPHREAICERIPIFREAGHDSHCWVSGSRSFWFSPDGKNDERVRYFVAANEAGHTKARHPAAARTVTAHGDFHHDNFLLKDDGKGKGWKSAFF